MWSRWGDKTKEPQKTRNKKAYLFVLKVPLTFSHKLCFPNYSTMGYLTRNSTHLQQDASCHWHLWGSAAYRLFIGTWDHISCQGTHKLHHSFGVNCPPRLQYPFSHLSNSSRCGTGERAQSRREGTPGRAFLLFPSQGAWGVGCEEPSSFTHPLWLCWTLA